VKHGLVLLLLTIGFSAAAQEIVTAERYLEGVSAEYEKISDYEADIAISSGNTDMTGRLSFLRPSFLRIDFTKPAEQVIAFNGELLTVYLPEYRAVLNQEVTGKSGGAVTGAAMASAQGLALLRRNYVPAFVTGPDPAPLDAGSREMVVSIRLTRRTISEGFREIILRVDSVSGLIRRIEGTTLAEAHVRFDFTNVKTNLGIPEGRFIYDSPASANVYPNFLFRDND